MEVKQWMLKHIEDKLKRNIGDGDIQEMEETIRKSIKEQYGLDENVKIIVTKNGSYPFVLTIHLER